MGIFVKQVVAPTTISSARTVPLGEAFTLALIFHRKNSFFADPENFVFC
jgi:hypothetical protein